MPTFSGNFTGGQVGNVNFFAEYGTGYVSGIFGFENITIANITMPNAQVALADKAYFPVNGSGIFGLAFPGLTSEYAGTDVSADGAANSLTYAPAFYKMFNKGGVSPTFSFAPQRNGSDGYLTFGGIPPVATTGRTAAVPILTVGILPSR